jgi:hypothetical protein
MQCKIVLMYVIIRRFIILIFPILELGNFFKHFMLRTLNNVEIERKKNRISFYLCYSDYCLYFLARVSKV